MIKIDTKSKKLHKNIRVSNKRPCSEKYTATLPPWNGLFLQWERVRKELTLFWYHLRSFWRNVIKTEGWGWRHKLIFANLFLFSSSELKTFPSLMIILVSESTVKICLCLEFIIKGFNSLEDRVLTKPRTLKTISRVHISLLNCSYFPFW